MCGSGQEDGAESSILSSVILSSIILLGSVILSEGAQRRSRRALSIGVTSKIEQRVFQHKHHQLEGYSADHNTTRLVYLERYSDMRSAIDCEKQLKGWKRCKKKR